MQENTSLLYAQLKNLSEMPMLNNYAADDIADDDDNMSFENNGNQSKSSSKTEKFTSKKANDTPVLDKYGIDVTRAAEQNQLDPVVGRDVGLAVVGDLVPFSGVEQAHPHDVAAVGLAAPLDAHHGVAVAIADKLRPVKEFKLFIITVNFIFIHFIDLIKTIGFAIIDN